ncbi:MAG: ABC transporter permease [Candidatus Sumerlaeia bacterium]|nr:ABC transporter permease [Candidatus Sumerlaeia bacterium]
MSEYAEFWRRFRRNPLAMVGLITVVFICLTAIIAGIFVPQDSVITQDLRIALNPPSWQHPFGTDHLGRDIFLRVVYASRTSLLVGITVVAIGMTLGTLLGLLSGYFGGWVDSLISRVVDIMLAFPFLLLAIAVSATVGPLMLDWIASYGFDRSQFSMLPVIIALGFATFPSYARLVRGSVLSIKEEQFVDSARAIGVTHLPIMYKHILPNLFGTLLVYGTLRVSTAILAESGLSFLGLGALPPEPTWGNMLSDGREYLLFYSWLPLFPGLAILVTVLGFNFLGDGLRDLLDPRMKDL